MKTKNPGLSARSGSIEAALAVSQTVDKVQDTTESVVGVGIRMSEAMHEELRQIAFKRRTSLNNILVAGVKLAIEADKSNTLDVATKRKKVISIPPKRA